MQALTLPSTLPSIDTLRTQFCSLPSIVLPEGHRIGHYEIVVPIELGDAVTGYAAFDDRDGSEVRLMEYLPLDLCGRNTDGGVDAPEHGDDRVRFLSGLRRFQNQGRTLAHLDAPALPRVRGCWSAQGTCYLAAAATAGRRLGAWRPHQDEAPGEALMWRLAQRLLEALEALHSVHCLHLEVSPSCIAIAYGAEPVLLEASSAWRLLDSPGAESRAQYQGHFAAPELHAGLTRGELIGPWTDIYALAATMFWLATGEPPPRAADRIPGDAAQAMDHLTRGRYSRQLLAAIAEGLALDLRVRARWAMRWREVFRQYGQIQRDNDFGDLLPGLPQAQSAPVPDSVAAQVEGTSASAKTAAGLPWRPQSPTAESHPQPDVAVPPPTRARMRIRALALVAAGSLGVLATQPLKPTPAAPAASAEPKRITIAGQTAPATGTVPAKASPVPIPLALVAPRPRFSAPHGHVTAALDIGPDGKVVTVAVLASDPPGLADAELVRTLLGWQYEPTGASERSTIDIAVTAGPK